MFVIRYHIYIYNKNVIKNKSDFKTYFTSETCLSMSLYIKIILIIGT